MDNKQKQCVGFHGSSLSQGSISTGTEGTDRGRVRKGTPFESMGIDMWKDGVYAKRNETVLKRCRINKKI
jgi:hypothetical protein